MKREPSNFADFVLAREQACEDLRLNKSKWAKNDVSPNCHLCAESFGLKNRRHHCRACGSLVCELCSSKRLQLSVITDDKALSSRDSMSGEAATDKQDRVCDGCFVRLCFEASQPSPDHFRIRQLKICADDLMKSIASLVEALEDPDGYNKPMARQSEFAGGVQTTPSRLSVPRSSAAPTGRQTMSLSPGGPKSSSADHVRSNEALIEAIRLRDDRLTSSEHLANKFLEVFML